MKLTRSPLFLFLWLAAAPAWSEDASTRGAASLSEAIAGGSYELQFRYRVESVDDDAFAEKALASVLKTRLTLKSLDYRGVSALIEVDDVSYLGDDDFNNTRNGNTQYPGVADPSGTDINQLFVRYRSGPLTTTLGRQRVNLDNERFVGGVGWRQNEQTYDALQVAGNSGAFACAYAFVNRVSRVFGPEAGSPAATLDTATHLLNGTWDGKEAGKVTAYAYLLDLDDAATLSTRTIGARYANTFTANDLSFPVVVELARQQDYADNPASFSLNYVAVEAGVKVNKFSVRAGLESLEGDGTTGFSTPLATGHKFQGWADKFLATPATGIDDLWFSVSGNVGGFVPAVTWHRFESDTGNLDYGDEIDVSVSGKVTDHISMLVKLADYRADAFSTDTVKLWLMLTATF